MFRPFCCCCSRYLLYFVYKSPESGLIAVIFCWSKSCYEWKRLIIRKTASKLAFFFTWNLMYYDKTIIHRQRAGINNLSSFIWPNRWLFSNNRYPHKIFLQKKKSLHVAKMKTEHHTEWYISLKQKNITIKNYHLRNNYNLMA